MNFDLKRIVGFILYSFQSWKHTSSFGVFQFGKKNPTLIDFRLWWQKSSTTIIYCGPIVSAFLKIELFSWFYIPLCVILLYACGWCLLFLFNKPLCLHKVCFLWLITLLCQNQSRMFVDCCCACLIDLFSIVLCRYILYSSVSVITFHFDTKNNLHGFYLHTYTTN